MKSCRDTAEIARRIGAGQHDPAEDGAFVSAVADLCGFTRLDVDIAERFRPTGAIAEVHELGQILFPGGHISDDETALFIGPGLKIVVIIDGRVKEFLVGIGDAERVGAAGVVLTQPRNSRPLSGEQHQFVRRRMVAEAQGALNPAPRLQGDLRGGFQSGQRDLRKTGVGDDHNHLRVFIHWQRECAIGTGSDNGTVLP